MSQLPLFADATETVLVNDERGRVVYTSGVVSTEVARAWFAELRDAVTWKTQRRQMYDREVDVPRLMAHFRLAPEEGPIPEAIHAAAGTVAAVTGVPFNSVGLNFYRDGSDSVAPHNDHLDEIVHGFPIALLSLGATRRMAIRAKEPPRRVLNLDLEAGSLLVMSYETQRHYTHGIPKTREPVGPRISLAFRVKTPPSGRACRARRGAVQLLEDDRARERLEGGLPVGHRTGADARDDRGEHGVGASEVRDGRRVVDHVPQYSGGDHP